MSEFLVGKKKSVVAFRKETHLKIVALKRNHRLIYSSAVAGDNDDKAEIEFKENDTLVLAGELKDIKRFIHE
jgi:K+/H+ antiporter YhaU regulatory subunit KhtT